MQNRYFFQFSSINKFVQDPEIDHIIQIESSKTVKIIYPPVLQIDFKFKAVSNQRRNEIDLDAEDLAKAALIAIDDLLDEEIVAYEPE